MLKVNVKGKIYADFENWFSVQCTININIKCEISSKLTIEVPDVVLVLIVNFEYI